MSSWWMCYSEERTRLEDARSKQAAKQHQQRSKLDARTLPPGSSIAAKDPEVQSSLHAVGFNRIALLFENEEKKMSEHTHEGAVVADTPLAEVETQNEEEEAVGAPDPEHMAAAAAAVSYAAALEQGTQSAMDAFAQNPHNKWSKNGYGAPVNRQTGKFTKEESELVRTAIEEFCNGKQITVSRLCSECDHKAELKGAWMEIAKRLPHRSVQSVYRHGIRQCHPFKRGAWSEQECVMLQDLVTRMGKKWSAIQSKLNRSADSCRDKYREMSDDYVKGRWKEEETDTLKRLIREYLSSQTAGATDAITDMKELGKLVEEESIQIPWSIVSKRMGKRSRLSCFKKWQKMTGLVSASDDKHQRDDKPHDGIVLPDYKRAKTDGVQSAGAAAAVAIAEGKADDTNAEAELAAETVEALELPDTVTLKTEV